MSKLEELIQELCPDGVEYKEIGDIATCFPGATPKTSNPEYWENGTIPWMSSGEVNYGEVTYTEKKITQLGYDNTSTKMVPVNSVVIALAGQGKTRGTVAITRIPLCTNQSLCAIVPKSKIMSEFLLHFLRSQYQQLREVSSGDGTRGGLNLKMINAYKIPVPPLPVQEEIVRILHNFTELTAELTAELSARKKQYEYYRKELLTFTDDVKKVPLIDVVKIKRGVRVVKSQLAVEGEYPVFQNSMTPLGYMDKANCTGDTAFIITAGAAGEIGYTDNDFWAADDCFSFECPQYLKSKYLYYILLCQQNTIYSKVRKASIPRLPRSAIEKLIIPVPSVDIQEKIVDVLDRFDTLCNDISKGLPAEIVARQKQYEYYRDKLLTFKESSDEN